MIAPQHTKPVIINMKIPEINKIEYNLRENSVLKSFSVMKCKQMRLGCYRMSIFN